MRGTYLNICIMKKSTEFIGAFCCFKVGGGTLFKLCAESERIGERKDAFLEKKGIEIFVFQVVCIEPFKVVNVMTFVQSEAVASLEQVGS